jgi:hypothetical protein
MSMSKKQIAVKAALKAFELGAKGISLLEYKDACAELSAEFAVMMAASAKEDQQREEEQS